MIALRLVGDSPPLDLTFLDVKDVPVILFAIVLLIYAYFKVKRRKNKIYSAKLNLESKNTFDFKDKDVLMQPKKIHSHNLPLINFSMPHVSIMELILGIALIVFYYLIFTGKI